MTASSRAATFAIVASALAAAPIANAQTQPPPFDQPAPRPLPPPPPISQPPTAPPVPEKPTAPPVPEKPPAPPVSQKPPAPPPPPAAPASGPAARATAPPADDDAIDDPKVSRRLGARVSVPAPPPTVAPAPVAPAPRPVAPAPAPIAPLPAAPPPRAEVDGTTPTIERPYTPAAEEPFRPSLPRLKLGLRRFDFVQIGASPTPDGIAARETFNSIGFDVYPVSNVVRIGLSTAYGWQSGNWLANGDYFATQSFSFGGQYSELGRVVPFAELFGGVGYMRRLQFDRTIPTAFWQFGADAGVEVYVARVGYLSLAIGYLRPVNGFAKRQQFTTIFVDTWSFKLGIGI